MNWERIFLFTVIGMMFIGGVFAVRGAGTRSDEALADSNMLNGYEMIYNSTADDLYIRRIFVGESPHISIVTENNELLIEGGDLYIQGNLNITGCVEYNNGGARTVVGTCR